MFEQDRDLGSRAEPAEGWPAAVAGPLTRTVHTIGVGLAVFLMTWGALSIGRETGRIAPLWPANAFLLACLLRSDARRWRPWLIAALIGGAVAEGLGRHGAVAALGLSVVNTAEVLFGALGLRRFIGPDLDLSRRRDILVFIALPGFLIPLIGGMVALAGIEHRTGSTLLAYIVTWTLSDGLSALIVTPVMLAIPPDAVRALWASTHSWRNLLLQALVAAVTAAVFAQSQYPVLFVISPFLVLAAFQMESAGVAVAMLLVAFISAGFTLAGRGPVAMLADSLTHQILALQIFLAISVLSILPVAAALARSRQMKASLAASRDAAEAARLKGQEAERWARMAEQVAGVGYWRLGLAREGHPETLAWSPEIYRIYDMDPAGPPDRTTTRAAIHPDDLDRVIAGMAGAESRGIDYADVHRIRRLNGAWRTVSCRTISERDAAGRVTAIIGTLLDITPFKQIERAALESEARYRLLADKASDIISRVDLAARHTYMSPASLAVLGYAPEELVGALSTDFVHLEDREALITAYETQARERREHASQPIRYRFRHKQGQWIWLETHPTVVLDERGKPSEFISVSRDVTLAKAAEAELMAAREAAEAATEAKGEFLANMSHEIRTPLTSIMGFSGLLMEVRDLPETARLYLERISTAGQSLLAVVNDILDFSKLEAGQVELDPQPFDPEAFITDTAQLLAIQAANKGLDWRIEVMNALPEEILADGARLRQVLLNLLGNAIKFTAAGGVRVQIGYEALGGGRLSVSIVDTGAGVPAERQDRLFQRFSQVDGSVSRVHGGTGLGLAICKSLVELMGGEIGVTSRQGRGSTFWFTIAAPVVEALAARDIEAAAEETDIAGPAHILIVDDLAVNRELVRAMLTPFGHSFEEADNGADAVRAALRSRFDLILMDLQMPGMDGFEAARAIRDTATPNRSTPIIALSANVLPAHVIASRAAGMDDHLGKPIVLAALATKVARWAGAEHTPDVVDQAVG